jgi:hypothetical protein
MLFSDPAERSRQRRVVRLRRSDSDGGAGELSFHAAFSKQIKSQEGFSPAQSSGVQQARLSLTPQKNVLFLW